MRLAASHHRRIMCTKLSWTGRRREAVFCARTSRAAYICAMYASVCRCDACIPAPWPVPICNGVPAMMARSAGLARGAARGSTKFGPRGAMAVEEDGPGLRGAMAVEEDGLASFARGEPRICGGIHSVAQQNDLPARSRWCLLVSPRLQRRRAAERAGLSEVVRQNLFMFRGRASITDPREPERF